MIAIKKKNLLIRYHTILKSYKPRKKFCLKKDGASYFESIIKYGVNGLDLPIFQTSAKKIQILTDPIEFYSALLVKKISFFDNGNVKFFSKELVWLIRGL